MGIKLAEHQRLLRRVTSEVLHYLWDPIGVAGTPQARDEYDAYIPHILKLLEAGVSRAQIAQCLYAIETESMGFSADSDRLKILEQLANILIDWREHIQEQDDFHTS